MNRLRRQQIVAELSRLDTHEFDSLLGEVNTARGTEDVAPPPGADFVDD